MEQEKIITSKKEFEELNLLQETKIWDRLSEKALENFERLY
jgi:hypothetical protein|tara:strand:- start:791 stop:913 length:123 start_codon:yes stop_codon:yes gene_type:complete